VFFFRKNFLSQAEIEDDGMNSFGVKYGSGNRIEIGVFAQ